MNATSVDIADMLMAESSLGLEIKENLFVGKEPTKPPNCVTVYDSYGLAPQLTLAGQGEAYLYESVQIRIRNEDYRAGMDLALKIMLSLHGRASETWNGTLYTVIFCISGPALLSWDDNELAKFIINFNLQRR
jgi:hypothetical protein